MAVMAMDSLSYPPPTLRIKCAGTIAIMAMVKIAHSRQDGNAKG
jgi:hypothetical protein